MKFRNICAYTFLISIAPSIHASDYSQSYTSCMDKSEGVTVKMLNCDAAEMAQQDARLNHFYKVAKQNLTAEQSKKLLAAQRAWLTYRQNDCDVMGSLTGGTIDNINGSQCFLIKTKNRADELEILSNPL